MGYRRKVPPAPHRPTRGLLLLDEVPDGAGVVLWQLLRHLRDWIETPQARRAGVFPDHFPLWVHAKRKAAQLEAPEIADEIGAVCALTDRAAAPDAPRIARACHEISEWAEQRQYMRTAVEFAEAAAALEPMAAKRANAAARVNRNRGEFVRADAWFERGIALARVGGDRVEFTRGHLGAGILCMLSGREERAQLHLNRASNVAVKHGYEWLAAEAQHDLFRYMTVRGHYVEAEIHARRALRWYPKHHRRFPLFVADVSFLLVCERQFSAAVTLLRYVLRLVAEPPARMVISSLLARALAGAGRVKEFERVRRRVLKQLAEPSEWEPATRWNLAEGERSAGMWDEAEASTRCALELARARRDAETEQFADQLLREIGSRTPNPAAAKRTDEAFRSFLNTLTTRLSDWSPTRRGRVPTMTRRDWAA